MVHYLIPNLEKTEFTRKIITKEEQKMAYINNKLKTYSTETSNPYSVVSVNADYTAKPEDKYIGVVSELPIIITLPSGSPEGKTFIIKNEWGGSSGKITVTTSGGELIDRAEVFELTEPFESATFVSRGGHWYVV